MLVGVKATLSSIIGSHWIITRHANPALICNGGCGGILGPVTHGSDSDVTTLYWLRFNYLNTQMTTVCLNCLGPKTLLNPGLTCLADLDEAEEGNKLVWDKSVGKEHQVGAREALGKVWAKDKLYALFGINRPKGGWVQAWPSEEDLATNKSIAACLRARIEEGIDAWMYGYPVSNKLLDYIQEKAEGDPNWAKKVLLIPLCPNPTCKDVEHAFAGDRDDTEALGEEGTHMHVRRRERGSVLSAAKTEVYYKLRGIPFSFVKDAARHSSNPRAKTFFQGIVDYFKNVKVAPGYVQQILEDVYSEEKLGTKEDVARLCSPPTGKDFEVVAGHVGQTRQGLRYRRQNEAGVLVKTSKLDAKERGRLRIWEQVVTEAGEVGTFMPADADRMSFSALTEVISDDPGFVKSTISQLETINIVMCASPFLTNSSIPPCSTLEWIELMKGQACMDKVGKAAPDFEQDEYEEEQEQEQEQEERGNSRLGR